MMPVADGCEVKAANADGFQHMGGHCNLPMRDKVGVASECRLAAASYQTNGPRVFSQISNFLY